MPAELRQGRLPASQVNLQVVEAFQSELLSQIHDVGVHKGIAKCCVKPDEPLQVLSRQSPFLGWSNVTSREGKFGPITWSIREAQNPQSEGFFKGSAICE